MDSAAWLGLAWTLAYVVAFAGPTFLVVRRRGPLDVGASLPLSVATAMLVGFGVADGVGIGAAILPFGLAAMGALSGSRDGARWLAATASGLALALWALMVWGPFTAHTSGIEPPRTISLASWLAWGAAAVVLVVGARSSPSRLLAACVAGAALLWAGVFLGPGIRTYFMAGPALVASAGVVSAGIFWRRDRGPLPEP